MTKLISLRIDERALSALNKHMQHLPYWKRHGILVRLLENVLLIADSNTIVTIVRHWHDGTKKLIIDAKETEQ